MTKALWITLYQEITDPVALKEHAKLAIPAVEAHRGRILVRGLPTKVYEAGKMERTMVIEFDSIEQAIAAHDSPQYKLALDALGGGAVRDMRIVEFES